MSELNQTIRPAIVSRRGMKAAGLSQYLQLSGSGAARWIDDPQDATTFESMREALRAATRLPARCRAYAASLPAERLVRQGMI
jgi:hypothetical protein